MDIFSTYTMNNGLKIPILGLGTYLSQPGFETYDAVIAALEFGYRHIDTAALYGNESDVGEAVRDSGIPRDEIFVTTKVWNEDQGYEATLKAFELSRKRLDIGYVDLYLIHWPLTKLRKDTWRALEKIHSDGYARSIGVSNYTIRHIEELYTYCKVEPVVNQVEFSTYLNQKELLEFCQSKNIYIEAYSPLARGKKFDDLRLLEVADKYNKTFAQIMIRWALQTGTIVIPKSIRKERIIENGSVFDFEIMPEEMELLDTFNENFRVAWNPTNIQ